MINKISIKNFQSILSADLSLGKITMIVGESDSGKSALFRAIQSIFDCSAKSSYITVGSKELSVNLDIDGNKVGMTKNNKGSVVYNLNEKRYKKVTTVPDEIISVIGNHYLIIDDEKIKVNFQSQFEEVFGLALSGRKAGKLINFLFGLESVYNAISNISLDLRNKDRDRKNELDAVNNNKLKIEKLNYIEKVRNKLNDIEKQSVVVNNILCLLTEIFEYLTYMVKVNDNREKFAKMISYESTLNKQIEVLQNVILELEGCDYILHIDSDIKEKQHKMEVLENKLNAVDLQKLREKIELFEKVIDVVNDILIQFEGLKKDIATCENNKVNLMTTLDKAQKEFLDIYNAAINELDKYDGCFICNSNNKMDIKNLEMLF